MKDNSNHIQENDSEKDKLPIAQKIVLAAILFGYPLISTLLYYANPPSERIILSRILQVYMPALLVQLIILLGILWVILRTPVNHADNCWSLSKSLASLGIKHDDFSLLNFAIGVIFLFVAIIILNIISNIINYYGFFQAEDISYLLPRSTAEKVFWIILSVCAGITEEICFRGYVISRMSKLTGTVWPGVILGSISFGLGHLYQGMAGVALISLYGIMFCLLFIARGSLVPCMIAHALQDILAAFVV